MVSNGQGTAGKAPQAVDTSLLDLMICRIPGLKGDERVRLTKEFDDVDVFSCLSGKDIENFLGRFLKGLVWTMGEIRCQAEKDEVICRKLGICFVSYRENKYPPLLREIYDPPVMLFYRGLLPEPQKAMIAVVGTRKPTSQAACKAFDLGKELGEAGISVVSGLALGIDSVAHRGNIAGGGRTVAVLGSSPDIIYPSSNRDLARNILETGGIIASEYPPGTGPRAWTFPARNRIISALARGVVIVEAPDNSGALITAEFALEQGRDLWVHEAGKSSSKGAGTLRLAEEGAKVISCAEDIFNEWNMIFEKEPDKRSRTEENIGAGLASSLAESLGIKV